MTHLIGQRKPRISEVHCTRIDLGSGARVLARVFRPINEEQRNRIRRMLEKWAGDGVEVFVYDATQMEVRVEKQRVS